jgi:hypothetical protein
MTRFILPAYIGLILIMSASEGQTNQKQTIPELWKQTCCQRGGRTPFGTGSVYIAAD